MSRATIYVNPNGQEITGNEYSDRVVGYRGSPLRRRYQSSSETGATFVAALGDCEGEIERRFKLTSVRL